MKISLINMPFAPVGGPSIGLTQIESVLKSQFDSRVDLQTYYLNLDFAAKMKGSGFYSHCVSSYGRMSGLSDWLFRSVAFPQAEDTIDEYLARFYYDESSESRAVVDFVCNRRQEMCGYLDELIERYDLASSDIVGFSLCFFQTVASIAMANRLKAVNPDVTVVFGGPAVKGVQGKTLVENIASVDHVFSGPSLASFPKMVACMLSGDRESVAEIQGVFTAGVDTGRSPEREVGANIDVDTEIALDYEPFLDKYEACIDEPGVFPFLLMQTSRGCWWGDRQRCTFCGLNCLSEKFEAMSSGQAVRHINSVLKYSDRVSYFVACDNITPPGYFKDVFREISTPEGVYIKYETRPDISAAEIKVLCDAGIRCVQPGVEALSTESLKLMRKGVTAFSNIRFLKNCVQYGLFAEWNILLFSPGESEDVYRKYEQDIPKLAHLQPPVDVFPIEFVRDSCYFEHAEEYGLQLEPHESLSYIYPFDPETLAGLACRFNDRGRDREKMECWLETLGSMVAGWREKWSVEPDKRPRLILWRDEHSAVIYDSRTGEGESYRITDEEERLLITLERPLRIEDSARECGLSVSDAKKEIDLLNARGLLFEENGIYLSLAIKEQE